MKIGKGKKGGEDEMRTIRGGKIAIVFRTPTPT
jgi:ABC-type microcin C transport system duplicated ATPase subunit YejF